MRDIPLILFAKAPVVGQVKTRLTPDLAMETAAEVAKILLEETLKLTMKVWPGKVILAVWPDLENDFIQQMLSRYGIDSIVQVEGNLGHKMFAAMENVRYPCAVMGCDVPHCSEAILVSAHQQLIQGENVIGPTFDGGYYLLGLQQSNPMMFEHAQWGGDAVFVDSMKNAEIQKIIFSKLEALHDIDTYNDLLSASNSLVVLKKYVK